MKSSLLNNSRTKQKEHHTNHKKNKKKDTPNNNYHHNDIDVWGQLVIRLQFYLRLDGMDISMWTLKDTKRWKSEYSAKCESIF